MWQYQDQTIQPAAAATRQPNQPQVIYMNSEGNQGCPMWNSGIPPTPGGDRASSANYSMRPGTMPYGGGVQYATNMQYADPVFNASGSHATAYGNNGGATAMTPVASGAVSSSSRSLFDRLGGLYPISAVVDRFSDEILKDSKVGRDSPNPQLRDWSRNQSKERLPGLKVQRTLWVAAAAGGPVNFQSTATKPGSTPLGLENAHRGLKISPDEFDQVANILSKTMDEFKIPTREKAEVLAAFNQHKAEVTSGYTKR